MKNSIKNSIELVVPQNNLPDGIKHLGIVGCRVFHPRRRSVTLWDSRVVMRNSDGRRQSHLIQVSHQAVIEMGEEKIVQAVCNTALKLIENINSYQPPVRDAEPPQGEAS